VLARDRASGEHEKRETVEEEAFAGLLLSRRRGEAVDVRHDFTVRGRIFDEVFTEKTTPKADTLGDEIK